MKINCSSEYNYDSIQKNANFVSRRMKVTVSLLSAGYK